MKNQVYISIMLCSLLLGAANQSSHAETVNTWQGNAGTADWNEPYKWNLHHPPIEGEAAHFSEANSVISVNSTIRLDNGMHLYGEELLLKGNGNINLWSQVPHERTVNIPASAVGHANLTLCDNLSLNGRISLSAKSFGTTGCKGTITLKDRSRATGGLVIGNEGLGSGQVVVLDNAIFRITNMELNTRSDQGGMAEIDIMGGTVRIESDENLFEMLMADPSRKIVIGDKGTLRIESKLPIAEKKEMITQLITEQHLVPAPGCRLSTPILQDDMMIARAEDLRLSAIDSSEESIIAAIDNITTSAPNNSATPADPGELVKALHKEVIGMTNAATLAQSEGDEPSPAGQPHMAGYIVFMGTLLLVLRKSREK